MVYLDFNATTPVDSDVLEVMLPWLRDEYGNPSSGYPLGQRAAAALETARGQVAKLIGASPEGLMFTSCGTESITTAIQSCAALDPDRKQIITSTTEHSATVKICEFLAQRGYEITWVPVDSDGQLDLQVLKESMSDDTALVSLLWANNETGVVFPVEKIAEMTSSKGIPLHIDAVQAVGKIATGITDLPIQFLSLSGHKLYGPKGIGALWRSSRVRFTPLLRGSQEDGRRGGTQNVASIVAFGKAAEMAAAALPEAGQRMASLRDRLESGLISSAGEVVRNGSSSARLPNTTNLAFPGADSEGVLMLLGTEGLCCSAGSACTTGSVSPSHVLRAMGRTNEQARSSLRFSLGRTTTEAEIDTALEVVPRIVSKLRSLRSAGPVAKTS